MNACDPYRDAVTALAAGQFDALAPQAMAWVEGHLNECERCAGIVAGAAAALESNFAARVTAPSAAEWERVWQGISRELADTGTERSSPARGAKVYRLARTWGGLAVAAVVVMAVGLSVVFMRTAPAGVKLAGAEDVQIEALEAGEGVTQMVMSVGEADPISIIWVVEEGA